MSSPFSLVLGDTFILNLEQSKMKTVINETELYVRFTDDTLIACGNFKHASS